MAVLGATVALSSPTPAQAAQPAAAVAAAHAARIDTVTGARLQVILLTVGQGELVWEKFGHNMLWIRDTVSGEGLAWNWGKFSFDDPAFLKRFLLGDTRYWMEGDDVASTLAYYQSVDREVIAQELALTPSERAALLAFVQTNALEEHQFYRYDYFVDNCSTRLRDALDLVLGGQLRAALADTASLRGATYRGETMRLMQDDPWLVMGVDIALGHRADIPLSQWEASFVPMRLRDAIGRVQVTDDAGRTRRLVSRQSVLVPTTRAAEPRTFPVERRPYPMVFAMIALTVLLIGLGLLRLRGVKAVRIPIGVVAVSVHVVLGLLATILWAMWLFTRHTFWAWNPHLLLMTPLSLVIAALIPWRLAQDRAVRWMETYHLMMAAVAFAVAMVTLVRYWQNDDAPGATLLLWAHASWMAHLGVGFALAPWRIRGRSPS